MADNNNSQSSSSERKTTVSIADLPPSNTSVPSYSSKPTRSELRDRPVSKWNRAVPQDTDATFVPKQEPIPEFDESQQEKNVMESGNVIMYTTHRAEKPISVKYEVESTNHEELEFIFNFGGSDNLKVIYPADHSGLVAKGKVPPHQRALIAVVSQIDHMKPTGLRMRFSWKKTVPALP